MSFLLIVVVEKCNGKSCNVQRTSNLTGAGADCPYSLVATHSYIAPLSSLVNLSKYKTLGASLNLDPPTGLLPVEMTFQGEIRQMERGELKGLYFK